MKTAFLVAITSAGRIGEIVGLMAHLLFTVFFEDCHLEATPQVPLHPSSLLLSCESANPPSFKDVPISEICRAAFWASGHAFAEYYTITQDSISDAIFGSEELSSITEAPALHGGYCCEVTYNGVSIGTVLKEEEEVAQLVQ